METKENDLKEIYEKDFDFDVHRDIYIREELFESVRDKAKAQDIRMRAIVEKAFEEFLKGE